MATRIGVDIGGTFTDLVFYDDVKGEVKVAKVSTTPAAPEEGVVQAVQEAIPREVLERTEYFLHGTTVGLNSLLERKGAIVGLLATKGFRDVLEIKRGDRAEMYNLFWHQKPPLVPRRLRLPITERIMADGKVYTELVPEDVKAAVEVFNQEGVTSVAIAFMNAYANPAHELKAAELLKKYGFKGEISISHKISGEYREYERTSTTVIDAFVRGRMSNYLKRLEEKLRSIGFKGSLLVTRSGSGCMTFEEAEERPFETIMSGPVAGAEGSGELARMLGRGDMITADVGGTSFDTCLIVNGRPQVMYEGSIEGMPIQNTWVDVRSIGAGGGSIAHMDVGGLMRVGPQSAGAVPGPASYGRGGTYPTVTDAAALLGMLGSGELASGIKLDVDSSRAVYEPLAKKLKYKVEDVAKGVLTIVTSNMANAIREITVEQGIDPRTMKLLPFGGAGPLMATLLARELDIKEIVIPPFAGNFSAWGLLGADMVQSASRTKIMALSDKSLGEVNKVLQDLFAEVDRRSTASGKHKRIYEASLDLRFQGQEHWLSIAVPLSGKKLKDNAAKVEKAFRDEYLKTFGGVLEAVVEIVSTRATLRVPLPRRGQKLSLKKKAGKLKTQTHKAFSFTQNKELKFSVISRDDLAVGQKISGPAIITESTATTYLDAGYSATLDASGSIFIKQIANS